MPRKSSSSVRISYPRFDTAWLVRALGDRVDRLAAKLPLRRVVLFGSYAKGTYTVASDVDLLVVYGGEPRPDAYALVKRTLDIPRLEPHLYTEGECQAMASTVARMTDPGVEIFSK
jgi:predicted nucleotidyltransferase